MKSGKETELVTRSTVLSMLSDVEVSLVSTAETSTRLANGEEYLDLNHLDQGVRRAGAGTMPMGSVLPKKSVRAATWDAIVARLPVTVAR